MEGLIHYDGVGSDPAPVGYAEWLADVKARVRLTQFMAARAANTEVIRLYWSIGKDILERQQRDGWGAKVIERLSRDMRREFPGQQGWSVTSLKYMRMMAHAWPTLDAIGQHGVDQLPWGHVVVLLGRLSTSDDRDWYAERAVAEGWKRSVLEHFIKVNLKAQLGAAPTNFSTTLPPLDSELAQQIVKDPYVSEHLAMVDELTERKVEQARMDRLQDTLTEFGRGMAFVGRQVRFEVTDEKGGTMWLGGLPDPGHLGGVRFSQEATTMRSRRAYYGDVHGSCHATGKRTTMLWRVTRLGVIPVLLAMLLGVFAPGTPALIVTARMGLSMASAAQ